jgi:hypothetical protein
MPLLELERSKKIFQGLLSVDKILSGLQKLLHRANVPLKVFQVFFRWGNKDQEAVEKLFSITRPGANKWRDLLELIEEISRRDNISPEQVLSDPTTQETLADKNLTLPQKYDRVHQALQQKQVARALDEMKLDNKTRLKYQEAFESNEIKLELKFSNERELSQQVEKIFKALQSGSVEKLIKVITG